MITRSGYGILLVLFVSLTCRTPSALEIQAERGKTSITRQGMVVSAEENASQTGVEILMKGGNAIDAAVATGFSLAVTYPGAGNLGGGGFMVIRFADGRATTIDYREKAPSGATRDMYLDERGFFQPHLSQLGYLASGVPGSVAGLLLAHERYGRLPLKTVLEPAIRLARQGFLLSEGLATSLNTNRDTFSQFASTTRYFTLPDNAKYQTGYRLVQKDLAKVIESIRDRGFDGFYRGHTADLIVEEVRKGGGLITHWDLESYRAIERPPVSGTYRGYRILSMGPPSSGGIALIQLLNALEPYAPGELRPNSAPAVHLMGEAMRRVYADRAHWLGDPDFVDVPIGGLLAKEYTRGRMSNYDSLQTSKSEITSFGNPLVNESNETTHYSVVDAEGNAVSTTTTINGNFGSMVVVDGAGFFLNNEMDDFAARPGAPNMFGLVGSEANSIVPGKRMLSSMTPTIIEDPDGRLFMVLGSPGGATIITTVLQVLVNVIDHRMDIYQAVAFPRIHHQWLPDELRLESAIEDPGLLNQLSEKGWKISGPSGSWGRADAILVTYPDDGSQDGDRPVPSVHKTIRHLLHGGADPRGEDAVAGY